MDRERESFNYDQNFCLITSLSKKNFNFSEAIFKTKNNFLGLFVVNIILLLLNNKNDF